MPLRLSDLPAHAVSRHSHHFPTWPETKREQSKKQGCWHFATRLGPHVIFMVVQSWPDIPWQLMVYRLSANKMQWDQLLNTRTTAENWEQDLRAAMANLPGLLLEEML